MKITFTLFVLFTLSFQSFSQDVIIRNNGKKIECEITNNDSLNVYFNYSNSGKKVSTSLPKSSIDRIIYESDNNYISPEPITMQKTFGGSLYFHEGKRLNMSQLVNLMKPNKEAYKIIKSSQSSYNLAMVLGCAGGFMVGWPLGTAMGGGEPNWILAGVGAGLIVVAIPLSSDANKKASKAVDLYNKGLPTSSFWDRKELDLAITGNGLGLKLRF